MKVKLDKPETIAAAYRNACAREAIAAIDRIVTKYPTAKGFQYAPLNTMSGNRVQTTFAEKSDYNSSKKDDISLSTQNPARRLSPSQVEDYRRKNLCFKCDAPYSPRHKCRGGV